MGHPDAKGLRGNSGQNVRCGGIATGANPASVRITAEAAVKAFDEV